MKIELGAAVVVAEISTGLYHLPAENKSAVSLEVRVTMPTLCGLDGQVLRYRGPLRDSRLCGVCGPRGPALVRAADEDAEHFVRRAARPGGKPARVTKDVAWKLYLVYRDAELSSPEICDQVYERLGFKSSEACRGAVEYQWRKHGWKMRSTREAEFIARRRHEQCAGIVDRKDGSRPFRCVKHVQPGTSYCYSHNPENAEKVRRTALNMNSKIRRAPSIETELVLEHVQRLLVPKPDRFGRQLETASGALARNTGLDPARCSRMLNGSNPRITHETANKILAPVGLTVDDILGAAAALAA